MIKFDGIGALFGNHIHGILNPTVRDDRDTWCVNHAEILDAVNLEAGINHTLLDIFGRMGGATRMKRCLGAIKDSSLHQVVILQRHWPRILVFNDILEALTILKNVIGRADTLADSNYVEIIVEVVQIDIGLLQGSDSATRRHCRKGRQNRVKNEAGRRGRKDLCCCWKLWPDGTKDPFPGICQCEGIRPSPKIPSPGDHGGYFRMFW